MAKKAVIKTILTRFKCSSVTAKLMPKIFGQKAIQRFVYYSSHVKIVSVSKRTAFIAPIVRASIGTFILADVLVCSL